MPNRHPKDQEIRNVGVRMLEFDRLIKNIYDAPDFPTDLMGHDEYQLSSALNAMRQANRYYGSRIISAINRGDKVGAMLKQVATAVLVVGDTLYFLSSGRADPKVKRAAKGVYQKLYQFRTRSLAPLIVMVNIAEREM